MRKLMLVAVVGTAFALTACKKEPAPEATSEATAEASPAMDASADSSEAAPEAEGSSAAAE